uniref:Uncharacterized protein n=1 Tax=Vibrio parahaemolyticus TaxID=670 RepID=A0A1Y1BA20_VIBPH|nr:hypothetical protein [Vibrio parahaemolyticus]BAX56983.1 hypothetical protein [Vibrio parahaemolyticus]
MSNGLVHPKYKPFQSNKKNGRHRLMTPILAQRILIFGGQIERLTLLV